MHFPTAEIYEQPFSNDRFRGAAVPRLPLRQAGDACMPIRRVMKTLLALLFTFVAVAFSLAEEPGFKMSNVVLYQPDEILQTRLTDAKGLAEYVESLDKVCVEHFAKEAKAETL